MKKRIFLLMMVSALLMAFAGSAWAGTNADYYTITRVTASPTTKTLSATGESVTINLTAATGYQSAAKKPDGYDTSKNFSWTVDVSGATLDGNFETETTTVAKTETATITTTWTGKVTFDEDATSATLTFTAKLSNSTSQTAEVTVSLVTSLGSADKMAITTKKVDALTVGTKKTFTIAGTGAGPFEYNVYIAAKDAIKLGWLEKGATDNISIADDNAATNIEKYHIPFTVDDVTTSIANKKGQKFSIPIIYNGAKVAYKGFPLTVAVWNEKHIKNGTPKPATKTFKIDINPDGTPTWILQSDDSKAFPVKYSEFTDDEKAIVTAADTANSTTIATDMAAFEGTTDEPVTWAAAPKKGVAINLPLTATAEDFESNYQQSFVVSGDAPYEVTVKPEDGKSGIKLNVTQPTYKDDGSILTPAYVTLTGPFDDEAQEKGKEAKVALTATVTNTSTKKKTALKINVVGKLPPEFQNTVEKTVPVLDADGSATEETTTEKHFVPKRIESPKKVNIKLKAKGSKTITYSVEDEDLLKNNYLSFDKKKAAIFSLKRTDNDDPYKGKEHSNPTVNEETGEFESLDIVVTAENSAGEDVVHVEVGVAGAKPKFKTKKLTISREDHAWLLAEDDTADNAVAGIIELANVTSNDPGDVVFTEPDGKLAEAGMVLLSKDYSSLFTGEAGAPTFDGEGYQGTYGPNVGMLIITDKEKFVANKGVKAEIYADNYGTVAKGKVTITIADPKPVIEDANPPTTETAEGESESEASTDPIVYTYTAEASDSDAVTLEIGLKLTDKTKPTDDKGKVKWKLESKPNKPVSAKLKADASDNSTATLTLTYKSKTAAAATGSVKVSATNSLNKLTSDKHEVKYSFTAPAAEEEAEPAEGGALPGNNGSSAKTSAEAEADAEDTEDAEDAKEESESEEATITTGVERTAADLTAAQQAFLAAKGLKVIAVLPEISANVEGQQEFAVELDEDAPEGATMVYVPFPQDAEETEDDKIADFYGADDEAIDKVPAEKDIKVAPWLRAGVEYQPVIAVEE